MQALFHLAFNVTDIDSTRAFYTDVLGCREGRSSESWVDFEFYGHQLSMHIGEPFKTSDTGRVGKHLVPMPHLGLILPLEEWQNLATRLHDAGIEFIIQPQVRFAGETGEQHTMFFQDPSGNPIEIKGFQNFEDVFANQGGSSS